MNSGELQKNQSNSANPNGASSLCSGLHTPSDTTGKTVALPSPRKKSSVKPEPSSGSNELPDVLPALSTPSRRHSGSFHSPNCPSSTHSNIGGSPPENTVEGAPTLTLPVAAKKGEQTSSSPVQKDAQRLPMGGATHSKPFKARRRPSHAKEEEAHPHQENKERKVTPPSAWCGEGETTSGANEGKTVAKRSSTAKKRKSLPSSVEAKDAPPSTEQAAAADEPHVVDAAPDKGTQTLSPAAAASSPVRAATPSADATKKGGDSDKPKQPVSAAEDEKETPAGSPGASPTGTSWPYTPPPSNQRTFYFPEDDLEFSSEFDSGNLIQVERTGAYCYNFYTCMDCGNTPMQTNNRQWFHFSVRGGGRNVTVSITMVGMMHSNMFTYEWMPVRAIFPEKTDYRRIPGRATVVSLATMPSTPGYPLLEYKEKGGGCASDDEVDGPNDAGDNGAADADGDDAERPPKSTTTNDSNAVLSFSTAKAAKKKKKKKKDVAMNLSFEFRMEAPIPRTSSYPLGHPLCEAMYIASNHPYSFSTLQANLRSWQVAALRQTNEKQAKQLAENEMEDPYTAEMTVTDAIKDENPSLIYFHREVLCRSLDGRPIDLITISDLRGIDLKARLPLLGEEHTIPQSSALGKEKGGTQRPFCFKRKTYVVLTARVHPGECPGSHMMHGALSFLMDPKDPRALVLREKFVFFVVPMINPDGVVRGHSRVDAAGVDLNRMYSTPSPVRQPAPFALRQLVLPLAREDKLSLYVDMHAHANRKGTFFYGNGLEGKRQVQNLLYAKLVALNTPYLEFVSCNFSEANMFAVGKSGKGKESSARIVWYLETGCLHSYAIESSHVAGRFLNTLPRHPALAAEDWPPELVTARYSPATFGDTGKAILLGLLDLHNCNPLSRLPLTPMQSLKGMESYIERQLMIEVAEKLFVQAYKDGTRVELSSSGQGPTANALQKIMQSLPPEDVPDKMTIRGARNLPPVTIKGLQTFLPMDAAITILEQTPAAGPPRSIVCPRVRSASPRSPSTCIEIPAEVAARRSAADSKKRQAPRTKSTGA